MKKVGLSVAFVFCFCIFRIGAQENVIAVVGTGYVGLTTGVGLAEIGNNVVCADIDIEKIEKLKNGEISIYEPGLESLVTKNCQTGRLVFTTDVESAIKKASIIFIAVGTPMGDDGSADLSFIESVAKTISDIINEHKYICIKSTVPVGTGEKIRSFLEENGVDSKLFDMVSNPEFLREGSAVNDFLYPDRIVIGVESDSARIVMNNIYKQFIENNVPLVFTNIATAETIKYASNAFLAVKISYINELSNLCDKTGAHISEVAYGMGLDHRISPYFLKPGPGFGGSCFPKDCSALLKISNDYKNQLLVVKAALDANEYQKDVAVTKLKALITKKQDASLKNKTVAILGLAFKANTDDVRYSPAQRTIELLLAENAHIKAYDSHASENMKKIYPNICYCSSSYEALDGSDACIIITEWDEFEDLDFEKALTLMNNPILIDARGIIDQKTVEDLGFNFDSIGRNNTVKHEAFHEFVSSVDSQG